MPDRPAVMLGASRLIFDSPSLLMAGIVLASGTVIALVWNRMPTRSAAFSLFALGLIVLAFAAGGPRWLRGDAGKVAVMVDVSASTRGATYHDEAALRRRVAELVGKQPYTLTRFGDRAGAGETTWTPPPPDASAVLLFSDGRFEPPATAPPVFAVIDPVLEQPGDAAVTSLERRGERLVVATTNGGTPREVRVTGVTSTTPSVAAPGARTLSIPIEPGAAAHAARLAQADPWPENDALSVIHPPPMTRERWWIGGSPPDRSWRAPAELPTGPAAYLAPAVIVLNNVPVHPMSPIQAQRLEQYVRDLGGGLLILGGDQAFAAGGYHGSVLGALSPLAGTPPAPAAHWLVLVDASGSMAGEIHGQSRLAAAVAATRGGVAQLPPNDLLSVGGFSDELRWWTRGKPVRESSLAAVAPARGPTNLDAALRSLLGSLHHGTMNHVVLLTDGQVELSAADAIAASLKTANARLHVFAIGDGRGLTALRKLADATGGTFAREEDVGRWATGLSTLLRGATPRHWNTTPVEVRFVDLPAVTAPAWNRTWLKAGADLLAEAAVGDRLSMSAQIRVGAGNVAAVAFRPPETHVDALAKRVSSPPRDPRFQITWRTGRRLVVDVDATEASAPINGLSPRLVLSQPDGPSETFDVPQTGPGRYVLTLPAPRSPTFATLQEAGRVIDRFALAGRYAPEFDGIGNDRHALRSLAQRTGGRIIEPGDRGPVTLPTPRRRGTSIARFVAAAGALLVALGLVTWRIER